MRLPKIGLLSLAAAAGIGYGVFPPVPLSRASEMEASAPSESIDERIARLESELSDLFDALDETPAEAGVELVAEETSGLPPDDDRAEPAPPPPVTPPLPRPKKPITPAPRNSPPPRATSVPRDIPRVTPFDPEERPVDPDDISARPAAPALPLPRSVPVQRPPVASPEANPFEPGESELPAPAPRQPEGSAAGTAWSAHSSRAARLERELAALRAERKPLPAKTAVATPQSQTRVTPSHPTSDAEPLAAPRSASAAPAEEPIVEEPAPQSSPAAIRAARIQAELEALRRRRPERPAETLPPVSSGDSAVPSRSPSPIPQPGATVATPEPADSRNGSSPPTQSARLEGATAAGGLTADPDPIEPHPSAAPLQAAVMQPMAQQPNETPRSDDADVATEESAVSRRGEPTVSAAVSARVARIQAELAALRQKRSDASAESRPQPARPATNHDAAVRPAASVQARTAPQPATSNPSEQATPPNLTRPVESRPAPRPSPPGKPPRRPAPPGGTEADAAIGVVRVSGVKPTVAPPPPPDPGAGGDAHAPQPPSRPAETSAPPQAAFPAARHFTYTCNPSHCQHGHSPSACPQCASQPACTQCGTSDGQCGCPTTCYEPRPAGSLFGCHEGAFYAGFEIVFLRPHFDTSDGLVVLSPGIGGPIAETRNFDHNFEPNARFHAGYVGADGFGVRFRFWDYDHSATTSAGPVGANAIGAITSAPISPVDFPGAIGPFPVLSTTTAGDRMQARHSLQMSTWDVEVTQQFDVRENSLLVSGGVRYLQIEQRYEVARWTATGGLAGALNHDHDFEGLGPTVSVEWIHPFGDGGLAVYGNTRGSVVFGTRNQTVSGFNSAGGLGAPGFARQDRRDQNAQIGVGEVGVGLQFIQGRFAARAGYEGQLWTDVGTASTLTGNMGLHGFAASIGFDF